MANDPRDTCSSVIYELNLCYIYYISERTSRSADHAAGAPKRKATSARSLIESRAFGRARCKICYVPDRVMPNTRRTSALGSWLLLIQQLPTRPAGVRIKTWRRLQQLGSVALKSSVYVLPNTPQAREDFEWLSTEIRAANGHASILAAQALTPEEDESIREAFRAARSDDYERLRVKAQKLLREAPSRPTGTTRQALERAVRALRDELGRIEVLDFFGAPARAPAADAFRALAAKMAASTARATPVESATPVLKRDAYRKRTWVTRPRPGIDRMASAWLIRRFIDPAARFVFADVAASAVPKRAVPFDMFGAEFGHQGDRCSFEALCERFAIDEPAVQRLGHVVHDVDLKEGRYSPPEAPIVAKLVDGLQATYSDDQELLQHGIALFAGLYESFGQPALSPIRSRATQPGARKRDARR